jgi:tetratricopeptide (TPR) repeat protein
MVALPRLAVARDMEPRYAALVARYAAGDRAPAVAGFGDFTERDLLEILTQLRRWAERARRCRDCHEREKLERLPVRAAAMLHTDREAFEREGYSSEQAPSCWSGEHAPVAEALVSVLFADAPGRDFARRWYLAMAVDRLKDLCLEDARRWAAAGLKWFARDADLLLVLGTVYELGSRLPGLRGGAAPVSPSLMSRRSMEELLEVAGRRQLLAQARRHLEEALAVSPGLWEARLRLGRVEWRRSRPAAAQAALEGVIAGCRDPALLYLARLFLGQVHEDAGQLAEAEVQYRAALADEPESQVAAVALSHALQLAGDAPAARAVLRAVVDRAGARHDMDPYWTYHQPGAVLGERLLDRLREEARR